MTTAADTIQTVRPQNRARGRFLHVVRCLLLVAIVLVFHWQHARQRSRTRDVSAMPSLSVVQNVFASAAELRPIEDDSWEVLDAGGIVLGRVIQTSPVADDVVGFSGPTNVLLGFDTDATLAGLTIVSSEDTRDHVRSVRNDAAYLRSWNGLNVSEVGNAHVDAVSGATLTCVAIQQSMALRLGAVVVTSKFPEPLTLDPVQQLFGAAARFSELQSGTHEVFDADEQSLGFVLRTSATTDNDIGYQGPTDVLIGLSPNMTVTGIAVLNSYDNQPYVRYVAEDYGFPDRFNELSLRQLAQLNLEKAGIEGVAGATMTSMSVARSLVAAAKEYTKPPVPEPSPRPLLTTRDWGTMGVTAVGLLLACTSLRGRKRPRLVFQIVLIGYLGLMNGDMLSQALLVGWAKNGVPWNHSLGLVTLTLAAFAVPISTGRNVYCSHLCPHGAMQQLMRNRLPWRVKLSKRVTRVLSVLPALLLLWVVIVAAGGLAFSLVDIEPFDAWLFRIAGVATIVIAIVGLVASLFVPMAYCRFGCPTGALLQFVRWNGKSSQFTVRDVFATACVVIAVLLVLFD